MEPFLRQVVNHYFPQEDLSEECFIFPNRRSLVFFKKYLSDRVASEGREGKPIVAPEMLTMNDFFFKVAGSRATDRVTLLLELYDCYKKLSRKPEALDDFIFWGDVILADFDDTDKYLADPKQLFTNIADLKAIQDSFSYLSENQRKAIEAFVSHFRTGGQLTVNPFSDSPNAKEKFLQVWDILYPLYTSLNERLRSKDMAYEGMVYHALAKRLGEKSANDVMSERFSETSKFVFVGLNALNECEKTVMRKMRDAGIAEFCWDYSSKLIRHPDNRSSVFMEKNLLDFPQAFSLADDPEHIPEIKVISVPSSVGQAKIVPSILRDIAAEHTGGDLSKVGKLNVPDCDCAIVLPDENLLSSVLNSIPTEIDSVNVTMGYPMSGSLIYSLMSAVSAMQIHLRKRKDEWLYYYKQVWTVFSNGMFVRAMGEGGKSIIEKIKTAAAYYVAQEDFSDDSFFRTVFRPVVTDPHSTDAGQIARLSDYLLEVLSTVASRLKDDPEMAPEMSFAKKYYTAVNRLKGVGLSIKPATYFRLLQQLVGNLSVPFKGEPLKGLQIMGPLETRALDFTNLVILSFNEGVFPHKSISSSFVPAELRSAFGLPTYENQDIVWAYYFYRMIQRAGKVWLLYDSRTEGLQSGEESRYLKQLEMGFDVKLDRIVAKAQIKVANQSETILKTEDDVAMIRRITYSPSTLNAYLVCPARFYYSKIKKLKPENEVSEALDGGMMGNVYHNTMYALYLGGDALKPDFSMERDNVRDNLKSPLTEITADYIDSLLKDKTIIPAKIRALILGELKRVDLTGKSLVQERIIKEYVRHTLMYDKKLMEEARSDRFRILGLEQYKEWSFEGFRFVGYIDRIDSFKEGEVRIVDYKTGKVEEKDAIVSDKDVDKVISEMFDINGKTHHEIAFQLFLYDKYVENDELTKGRGVRNVIYHTPKLFSSTVYESEICQSFADQVEVRLSDVFKEMTDVSHPFKLTSCVDNCKYCDFKKICGR